MKIAGMVLTILMAISSVASAHVDLCQSSSPSCENSIEDSNKTSSNNGKQTSDNSSSHDHHCTVHCAHTCTYFHVQSSLVIFNALESQNSAPYSFIFTQTFLEGPFRPPLA